MVDADYFKWLKPAKNNQSRFERSKNYGALLLCLREGKDVIIADRDFVIPDNYKDAIDKLPTNLQGSQTPLLFHWYCFENDLAACNCNVRRRNRDSAEEEVQWNEQNSPKYACPKKIYAEKTEHGFTALPVRSCSL